jgi:hypothetical protein
MKHRNSHLLVGYWSRLRKGRDVPDQTDIDPRAIKRMLSHIFILEAAEPTRPSYRLAGTTLCEHFGSELRGTNFLAHWDGQSRDALSALLRQSLALRQPVCLSSVAVTEYGMVELETVLAPLSFNDGAPTRFFGMTQVLSDLSALGGRPIAFERLTGSQMIRENEPISTAANPPPPPPPAMPYVEALRSHPRAPHLRLVVSRPASVHCEMDEAMQKLIAALDIVVEPRAGVLR